MPSASYDLPLPQKSLQIKQDDKFFSRLMSKETSTANSSSRVYYGGASGAIPFMWESRPGTPKHTFADASLPPLTPPPSYYSKSKSMQKNNKPKLLSTIFPRLTPKKSHVSPSSSRSSTSSSSWPSSSSSSSSYSSNQENHRCRHSSYSSCSRSPINFTIDDDDDEHGIVSPTSALCFDGKRKVFNGFRGCYPMVNMKNAFLSIVGHGSGQGTA